MARVISSPRAQLFANSRFMLDWRTTVVELSIGHSFRSENFSRH
jgi:hypothetical protein